MAKYTLVHAKDVENKTDNGTFKKFKQNLAAEQVTISLRTFPPHSGQRGKGGHKHEQIEEVIYVISGELIVKLDNEEVKLIAGDALRISPEVMRAYQNDGDKEASTIMASPVLPGQRSDGILSDDFWKD